MWPKSRFGKKSHVYFYLRALHNRRCCTKGAEPQKQDVEEEEEEEQEQLN